MKRLTDKKTAAALKSNAERLRAAGIEPSIMDQRYIKLAEYEDIEELTRPSEHTLSLWQQAMAYTYITECKDRQKQKEASECMCSCWQKGHWWIKGMDTCMGTREQEPCTCGGDRRKCDFYEHVRNEVK